MLQSPFRPLKKAFYQRADILKISQELLGKILFTRSQTNQVTAGIISEVEAYKGPFDRASHAFKGRRTPRNEAMYYPGGFAYVFKCYGVHTLFNVVTHLKDSPHAILIRSVIPYRGLEIMKKRRGGKTNISKGPGLVCESLGIEIQDNKVSLEKKRIWIEDHGIIIPAHAIISTPRIGIAYAKEHALLPWRYYICPKFKL